MAAKGKELRSAGEVIDALGGDATLAKQLELPTQNVWNWRDRQSLPPRTYLVITAMLARKGLRAPLSLWGMMDAAE